MVVTGQIPLTGHLAAVAPQPTVHPTQDSIVFDVNSFYPYQSAVTINLDVTHKAITVNNVLNNPLLFSSGRIILLTSNLTFNGTTSRFYPQFE